MLASTIYMSIYMSIHILIYKKMKFFKILNLNVIEERILIF